ncbi:MAG: DUF92 domain-containing protein [Acholeplasmataceae bacterium]
MYDLFIGFIISLAVAYPAYRKRSLSFSGMIAAVVFGTLIYYFGRLLIWSLLIAFFVSSSLLTKFHEKKDRAKLNLDRRGRNYVQVVSNAIVATIFVALYHGTGRDIFLLASAVSIATSNADTWASEIGILSKGRTFSIITFKPMEKGTSGAVSLLGLFASALGALFIAMVFMVIYGIQYGFDWLLLVTYALIIVFGGFVGALLDSFMGIVFQGKYRGKTSGILSELRKLPNEQTILISGLAFITNDAVNLLSGLLSSVLTLVLFAV